VDTSPAARRLSSLRPDHAGKSLSQDTENENIANLHLKQESNRSENRQFVKHLFFDA
jgi:hypothetical protein